jgi:hypothetical protein
MEKFKVFEITEVLISTSDRKAAAKKNMCMTLLDTYVSKAYFSISSSSQNSGWRWVQTVAFLVSDPKRAREENRFERAALLASLCGKFRAVQQQLMQTSRPVDSCFWRIRFTGTTNDKKAAIAKVIATACTHLQPEFSDEDEIEKYTLETGAT